MLFNTPKKSKEALCLNGWALFCVQKTYIRRCCVCPLLLQGDCLNLIQDIPEKSVDMILCDLPYGTTACKWDSVIPFKPLWEQYERLIKDNGAIVLFSSQPFTTRLIHSNMKDFRYCWYWKKKNVTGGQFAKVQPMRCIEDICVFYKQKPTYNPQGLIKLEKPLQWKVNEISNLYKWRGSAKGASEYTNYPKHFVEFAKDKKNFHPTQKPVALLEYLIKTYTNKGETVLDNCMGSGSTGVACVNTGRKFIGIELEEKYYNTAKERIEKALTEKGAVECKL